MKRWWMNKVLLCILLLLSRVEIHIILWQNKLNDRKTINIVIGTLCFWSKKVYTLYMYFVNVVNTYTLYALTITYRFDNRIYVFIPRAEIRSQRDDNKNKLFGITVFVHSSTHDFGPPVEYRSEGGGSSVFYVPVQGTFIPSQSNPVAQEQCSSADTHFLDPGWTSWRTYSIPGGWWFNYWWW